jgi:hypothetical protein
VFPRSRLDRGSEHDVRPPLGDPSGYRWGAAVAERSAARRCSGRSFREGASVPGGNATQVALAHAMLGADGDELPI